MRYLLLLAASLTAAFSATTFAQDTLVERSGRLRIVHVLEETVDSVSYYADFVPGGRPRRETIAREKLLGLRYADPERQRRGERVAARAEAQGAGDLLALRNGFSVSKYRLGGVELTREEVDDLFAPLPEASRHSANGRSLQTIGNMFGVPGGFLLGWQLVNVISSERVANQTLLYAGIGGSVVGAVLHHLGSVQHTRAVNDYNAGRRPGLGWRPASGGIGVAYRF